MLSNANFVLGFFSNYAIILSLTQMNSKPIDLTEVSSSTSWLSTVLTKRRLKVWLWLALSLLLLAAGIVIEFKTSIVQAWIFTRTNERLSFELAPGAASSIAFPAPAPFDDRRGYSKLADFQSRLLSHGFQVSQQARQSETMVNLISQGISPPYIEPPETGIDIRGVAGVPLFRHAQSEFLFEKIDNIPPVLVKTLLFLEDRDLDSPNFSRQNPAVEWDRFFKAALLYLGSKLYLDVPVQGGSTLAVQLEKFRHSAHGRTDSPLDKFRQIVGASLKAYRAGPNTRAWRDRIIVDYFNTVPLAAAPGYGEIHGLGEGLYAWFGMQLADAVRALRTPGITIPKVRVYKHVLTLLISVRAPSVFLVEERGSLEHKVNQFTQLLAREGIIDDDFAAAVQETPIQFLSHGPVPPQPSSGRNKAANAIRMTMTELLGVTNLYDLNRLHVEVESTIDVPLQKKVVEFLQSLTLPETIKAYGLNGERLLENSDPKRVIYSFLLIEPTRQGNFVRVQADNLAAPFDFNKSVKLELGSTAKLRTLTHYLELMAELHKELSPLDQKERAQRMRQARDPLTSWAIETLKTEPSIALQPFLERAMERRYSASPFEAFFTGGGLHHFENFDRDDNGKILLLRDAFRNSTNLVFIRLMRDVVSYHRARLGYNADAVLSDPDNKDRQAMLARIAEEESRAALRRAYQNFRAQTPEQITARLLGNKRNAERRLAILFFAWRIGADEQALASWLAQNQHQATGEVVGKLFRAYRNPRLTLVDYAYLLSLHPLDLWCASEFRSNSNLSWEELYNKSAEARRTGSAWLLTPRNRKAQDLRLRIRFERDAFARMTPYWQRLGFPFKTMVPSYATALGNSSDRPVALAELIGILVNDGQRKRSLSLNKIHFARSTPYETLMEPEPRIGVQVLAPEVARSVRKAMADVVEHGTARRLNGVFRLADGQLLTVGGKTGSGDNKYETFNRYGGVISSRATNRTAAFVFYIGDRYFGVITAYVQGREAADYRFTSALPVTLMKILAPTLTANIDATTTRTSDNPENGIKANATPHKISFDGPRLIPAPVTIAN
jgi:membrane peptidoglycan carboxypeptidase